MNTAFQFLGVLGFVLGVLNLVRDRLLPKHRDYQHYRKEIDGFGLPWWMCWVYWFGLERFWVGFGADGELCECKRPSRISSGDLNCQRCGRLVIA